MSSLISSHLKWIYAAHGIFQIAVNFILLSFPTDGRGRIINPKQLA